MSLYGALFAAVSGLKGQATKISVISDNIANVNTVGYKQSVTEFQTLVTNSGTQFDYSPGGVLAGRLLEADQQGLIQGTNSPTDIAVSGNGLFVVNGNSDGSGQPLFTRAGSFRQDSVGNFLNAAGFYLQAWPLDREGNLPAIPNLDSLQTVNVQSASGVAAATTKISVGANLNAGQAVFPGAGADITMDPASANNFDIKANDIIASDDYGAAPTNGIIRGDQFTVETAGGQSGGQTHIYTYGGFAVGRSVTAGTAGDSGSVPTGVGTGNILDASATTDAFLGVTGTTGFTTASQSFTINTASSGTVTFTYTSGSPNTQAGQFNNLDNLAAAINGTGTLTARVVAGRLYVGSKTANDAVTFTNGDATGTLVPPLSGIDWADELGVANVASGSNRFSNMTGLASLVNSSAGLSATISNPLGQASLKIFADDPLSKISFYDGNDNNIAVATNTGSLINEFGFATLPGYAAGATAEHEVQNLGPAYDSAISSENMASGSVTAQFSRDVQVFDALGTSHQVRMSFLKINDNKWAVEVHAIPASDVVTSMPDGQIATGNVTFNGDGSLQSVDNTLASPIAINWTNGASANNVTLNLGTAGQIFGTPNATQIGLTDGLSQFNSDYNVAFVNQNGSPVGQLVNVTIDSKGFVTASYTNGETQKLYKIPLADFNNPNGLNPISGNVYSETNDSGVLNLREPGSNGVGNLVSSALESSNVDLAEQLTDMIVAQRGYQANTKVITTTNELLQALTQL